MNCKEEIEFLEQSIKDFVNPVAKGVVVGLSGGVDSSVVAALCMRALGADNVFGVILPCYSNTQDSEDAYVLVDALGMRHGSRKLDSVYELLQDEVEEIIGERLNQITRANIKSRLRMTTLYAIANAKNYLVAGTGNKSEILTGYFTKYGDGGIDFEPIGDYYKTEDWKLARELEIPFKITEKKPSAGLWQGQTDEDELGMTYQVLDEVLKKGSPWQDERVLELIDTSRHKRCVPPVFKRSKK